MSFSATRSAGKTNDDFKIVGFAQLPQAQGDQRFPDELYGVPGQLRRARSH